MEKVKVATSPTNQGRGAGARGGAEKTKENKIVKLESVEEGTTNHR